MTVDSLNTLRRYLDLTLLIDRSERNSEIYHARVIDSPVGQAEIKFNNPFSQQQLEQFLEFVHSQSGRSQNVFSVQQNAGKQFGGILFETVFSGELLNCWRRSKDKASEQKAGLRVRLRLMNAPELMHWPWEFLYDRTRNHFLAASVETPIVRYLELPEPITPLPVPPPLRILVMISSPKDFPKLDFRQELRNVQKGLTNLAQHRLVKLELLDAVTFTGLQSQLRKDQYHIIHFIGHGAFDKVAQEGMLLFENRQRLGNPVSGNTLAMLLRDHPSVRLVILNSCEGARTSINNPFSGVAQSLVHQLTPAVIAMQSNISNNVSTMFAEEFYGALADNYPIDAALAEARKAIFAEKHLIDWAIPVLFMRAPDGQIFKIEKSTQTQLTHNEGPIEFDPIGTFYKEAQQAVDAGNWAVAVNKLEAILRLDPSHMDAKSLILKARDYQKQAEAKSVSVSLYQEAQDAVNALEWKTAISKLHAVLELQPHHAEAQIWLHRAQEMQAQITEHAHSATLYTDLQLFDLAAEEIQAILKLNPKQVEAKARLEQVQNIQKGVENRGRISVLLADARNTMNAGEWTSAAEILQRVLQLQPNHPEAISSLAQIRQLPPRQLPEPVHHSVQDVRTVILKDDRPEPMGCAFWLFWVFVMLIGFLVSLLTLGFTLEQFPALTNENKIMIVIALGAFYGLLQWIGLAERRFQSYWLVLLNAGVLGGLAYVAINEELMINNPPVTASNLSIPDYAMLLIALWPGYAFLLGPSLVWSARRKSVLDKLAGGFAMLLLLAMMIFLGYGLVLEPGSPTLLTLQTLASQVRDYLANMGILSAR